MIKCLYISYDGALEPLGQSQIISYLKGLGKRGIKFVLLTFDKKYYRVEQKSQQLYADLSKFNIKWIRLPYHKNPPVLSTIFDILNGFVVSLAIAIRERPNLVHARGYVSSVIALALKKILRLKFIFDMRGFWADEKVECKHWNQKAILYRLGKYFEGKFIQNADEIVVLTEQAKQIIERFHYISSGINISVIPCCVDVNIFKLDTKMGAELRKENNLDGKFVFAYTGSFETGYMKDEMLDYFKIVKRIVPNAHFLILSQSPKDEILELITKKQLKRDNFTIISSSFDQMPRYLSMVDAAMLFLSLGFSKLACSPTKFAEFLSCGIPVISSQKIGDTEESIVNNRVGVIVKDFSDQEYKRSFLELSKLLNDNNLRSRCRHVAEKEFSLDMGIDKYYTIYTRLKNELHRCIY